MKRLLRQMSSSTAGFLLALLTMSPAQASVDIADAPLFVTSNVEPNIMFIIDDSGSMMWETMPDALTNKFSTSIGSILMWLYPRIDGLHGAGDYNNTRVVQFAGNLAAHARSSHNNVVYYDPAVTYQPWSNADGSLMPDAPPDAAPNRPGFPGLGTRDLTQVATYDHWRTDGGGTSNATLSYHPATYYFYEGGDVDLEASYTKVEITSASAPFVAHGREQRSDCVGSIAVPPVCTYDEEIQNFANWYSYSRNRIFAARAGIGRAFAGFDGGMRVGYGAINHNRTSTSDLDGVAGRTVVRGVRPFTGSQKTDFFAELYNRPIPATGTPLRRALDGVGQYFSRDDERGPWNTTPGEAGGQDLTCRQSFAILMTDGFATGGSGWDAVHSDRRDNTDGTTAQNTVNDNPKGPDFEYVPSDPYQDSRGNTLADVAMYYWKRDLRPDLENNVPTSDRNEAFWQHMVTYGIGLGVEGTVSAAAAWQAVKDGTPIAWPDPAYDTVNCSGASCPARIDDLLHAAVNGRGGFFSARDPESFAAELSDVLQDIVARVDGSATSAATSSAVLQTDTLLYTAGFRSGDWSGRLDARQVNTDGSLGALAWDAEQKLAAQGHAARNIITRRTDGTAVPFEFVNLSASQQAALNRNASGMLDGLGAARVAWLRGDENASPAFRSRSESGTPRLLGDIVNSNPKFSKGVLYVGANDGMLHAFDAETGDELFAYVPSKLLEAEPGNDFAPLSRLMEPDYSHRFFVDGTVAVVDVTLAGVPSTVLVGSLGAGGRTVYALDVTSPGSFSGANVMWEFSHPELGYNVGQPGIVRMSDGTMAAVFGNGYNSASQRAMLFVVNLSTGALIQAIDTGVGNAGNPNGLAAPAITDWPVSNLRANRVYAGDLHGNLWRFNLSGPASTWNDSANVEVLFAATDGADDPQPITVPPLVALNPVDSNQVVVAFGTGSYFRVQDQDMPGAQVQSLYGIIDTKPGETGTIRADLLEQTITSQTLETFGGETVGVRLVSDDVFDATTHKGWRLDLDVEDGERVISGATFPTGPLQRRVRFSTLIPDEDPCGSGRRGFIMDLDLLSGGRVDFTVFDLNRDGSYDDGDMVNDVPVSGIAWGQGETPTVLTPQDSQGDPTEFIYTGEGEFVQGLGEEGIGGRQSWQQLR